MLIQNTLRSSAGFPGTSIEDARFSNIRLYYRGGGTREQAALDPPEKEDTYPEPTMFGELPAYGFFIRHVEGIEMRDVEVSYLKEDSRPPFILNDVIGADFLHVKAQRIQSVPTFVMKSVENFSLQQSWPLPDTRIERAESKKF